MGRAQSVVLGHRVYGTRSDSVGAGEMGNGSIKVVGHWIKVEDMKWGVRVRHRECPLN